MTTARQVSGLQARRSASVGNRNQTMPTSVSGAVALHGVQEGEDGFGRGAQRLAGRGAGQQRPFTLDARRGRRRGPRSRARRRRAGRPGTGGRCDGRSGGPSVSACTGSNRPRWGSSTAWTCSTSSSSGAARRSRPATFIQVGSAVIESLMRRRQALPQRVEEAGVGRELRGRAVIVDLDAGRSAGQRRRASPRSGRAAPACALRRAGRRCGTRR